MLKIWTLAALACLWSLGLSGCAPSLSQFEADRETSKASDTAPDEQETPKIDWASASDCRSKLELLQQAMTSGHVETLEKTPFTLISDQNLSDWQGSSQHAPGSVSDDPTKRCVIRLGRARGHKAEHRMLGRERIRSAYQSGSRMEKNPAYEAAQARLRQAERANKPGKSSIISVGDPLIDLIGMVVGGAITGIAQWGEGDPVEEAIENLMATPRSIEQPTYRPYQFERMRFRASREAVMPVIMTDRQLQQSWRISLKRREVRELQVLEGLDRQDRDYAEHRDNSMTDQEFRQWQAEPPELPLEDMIASLLDSAASTSMDRIASLDSAGYEEAVFDEGDALDAAVLPAAVGAPRIGRLQRSTPSAIAARSSTIRKDTVVDVIGKEHRGQGVYIASDFVLAGSELVEGQGLVDIDDGTRKDGFGESVLGLVAAVDRSRGLALIQVPRTGVPAIVDAFSSGTSQRPKRSLDDRRNYSPGAHGSGPILKGQNLVGFRSERGPDISIRDVRAFLSEQDALLISQSSEVSNEAILRDKH